VVVFKYNWGQTVSHNTATTDVQQTIMGLAYSGLLLSVSSFNFGELTDTSHLEGSPFPIESLPLQEFAENRHVFDRMLVHLSL
jgi:hypothetical protein